MKLSRTVRQASLAGVLTSGFVIFARLGNAQTVPAMTIEIHNNSDRYSLYPVLSTGAHIVDTWMQAAFRVPKSQLADNPYPIPNTFRLDFNPTGAGIPPHSSIPVTLPLYTQLVPTNQVNPKLPDQYIDWWNGGRISIYASLYASGAPPKALVTNYTARASQTLLTPGRNIFGYTQAAVGQHKWEDDYIPRAGPGAAAKRVPACWKTPVIRIFCGPKLLRAALYL